MFLRPLFRFLGRRWRRLLLLGAGAVLGAVLLAAASALILLRGSLPRLDGEVVLAGLAGPVTVTRDSLGVPDIRAVQRVDAARALGYLHAQDRFFQMDLQRRAAAGELAALLGPGLLDADRDARRHRFRALARQVAAGAGEDQRRILDAYTAGVNAGLDDLRARPFEYWVLRRRPEPWRPEDTILVLYSMFLDLSLSNAGYEQTLAAVRDNLPAAVAEMLLPRGNRWEAPLEQGIVPGVHLPDSTACDLRKWTYGGMTYQEYRRSLHEPPRQDIAGSNNWAVAGSLTRDGRALLANDMHLRLGLPNTWYRARMSWDAGGRTRSVVGVTLPGTPALVVGSNGRVAWGFTNSQGDWADLVILETDPADSLRYRTPDGWRRMQQTPEIIPVAGGRPDTLVVNGTIWGPVWGQDTKGRTLALRWTAHDTAAVNLNLLRLETAADIDEVMALAADLGIPQQNLVCADATGRIGWTIAGRIPRRVGWDGRLPVSWADGSCRWDGYLAATEQPRIVDPPEGRIWTANNRVAADRDLALIGDGGYATGARARQIRDDLRALEHPSEQDMLAVQLDDRAVFRSPWRDLALAVLARWSPPAGSPRTKFLVQVRDHWSGRAEVSSVSYRLVRDFSYHCVDLVYEILIKPVFAADPNFRPGYLPYRFAVAWEVLERRPANLLPPMYDGWDDLVLEAVDRVMSDAADGGRDVAAFTWGDHNIVRVAHPFVSFFPRLARWLAAPPRELPGDSFMPRVQHPRHGASERLVVSPGHEQDAIFHMPGGQSGHPLSPYFLAGHEAWATGRATPLLPGPAEHTLEFVVE